MSACWPDPLIDRHEMSGPTCRRHEDWHGADIVQKRVAEGTDTTHPNVGVSTCRHHVGKNCSKCYFQGEIISHNNQIYYDEAVAVALRDGAMSA
jgi:hypothetical protein